MLTSIIINSSSISRRGLVRATGRMRQYGEIGSIAVVGNLNERSLDKWKLTISLSGHMGEVSFHPVNEGELASSVMLEIAKSTINDFRRFMIVDNSRNKELCDLIKENRKMVLGGCLGSAKPRPWNKDFDWIYVLNAIQEIKPDCEESVAHHSSLSEIMSRKELLVEIILLKEAANPRERKKPRTKLSLRRLHVRDLERMYAKDAERERSVINASSCAA